MDLTPYGSWAGALATFLAVLVALRLHIKIFPPMLLLRLRSPDGVATPVTMTTKKGDTVVSSRPEQARYYHVILSNQRPWIAATDVGVFLVSVELEDASGKFAEAWTGALPVVATYYGVHPSRTLGAAEQLYDLCSVVKDKWVQLHLQILPNDVPHQHRPEEKPVRIRVTLQARSLEAVSARFPFEISWNGKWDDDTIKMRQHMVVQQLPEDRRAVAV